MTKLSVNLNKFALLRNARGTDFPNLIKMARRTIAAGAHGITVHPRPDQRHIKYSDVYDISGLLSEHPAVELNIEGNPIPRFLEVVRDVKPSQCTLVPDTPGQLTSDHGWDLQQDGQRLVPIIRELQAAGIRVSVFMDSDLGQINVAKEIGTDRIELYTEPYARVFGTDSQEEVYDRFCSAAVHAQRIGLGVNAGHDLNLENLRLFLSIPGILEVSIGHAIVVESFDYGFEETIQRYLDIIKETSDG
ncbi:pyridoxine 5'-phosphate synthase [candidate division WOR-3 bacterium]|nr:pyridoxine 5'-phosphate synthase [candidate division WOR-3 bacterium]